MQQELVDAEVDQGGERPDGDEARELTEEASRNESLLRKTQERELELLRARFELVRDGVVNGLAGWFRAELAPGVCISTAPAAPDRIDREGVLMPLDPVLPCRPRDVLNTRFRALLGDGVTVWEAGRDGEPARRHSSWQSYTAAPLPRRRSDGLEADQAALD